jgi:hypothetical protein
MSTVRIRARHSDTPTATTLARLSSAEAARQPDTLPAVPLGGAWQIGPSDRHRSWRRVQPTKVVPEQALFPSRRHRTAATSAVDFGPLREVPAGQTGLTTVFVEATESGPALCDEVNPIPALGQRIPLSIHRRNRRLLQALTLQELRHGTLSTDATHSEQGGLMARRAAAMTHAARFSVS